MRSVEMASDLHQIGSGEGMYDCGTLCLHNVTATIHMLPFYIERLVFFTNPVKILSFDCTDTGRWVSESSD